MSKQPLIFLPPDEIFEQSKVLDWKLRVGEPFMEGHPLVEIESTARPSDVNTIVPTTVLVAPISGYLDSIKLFPSSLLAANDILGFIVECPHDVQFGGLCAQCAKDVSHLSTETIVHGHPKLSVTRREARRIDEANVKKMLSRNKLALVLDLDHTLVHATTETLVKNPPIAEDIIEFTLPPAPLKYYVKLRPGLKNFLKQLNSLYELHIYTMGTRQYATKIAEIIDQDNVLFKEDRIISRDDCGDINLKNLQRLFPFDDSMVLILDDREDVWLNSQNVVSPNLIKVEPFHFFDTQQELNALPQDQQKKDGDSKGEESPKYDEDYLEYIHDLLSRIHTAFYASDKYRDVKIILQKFRRKVLKGCVIVFSGLIPINTPPEKSEIWRITESFGAKCCSDFGPTVTHVVAAKPGTDKVTKAASSPSVFLVSVEWLSESLRRWKRAPELLFPLSGLPVLFEGSTPPLPTPASDEVGSLTPPSESITHNATRTALLASTQSDDEGERAFKKQKLEEENVDIDSDDEMIAMIEEGLRRESDSDNGV